MHDRFAQESARLEAASRAATRSVCLGAAGMAIAGIVVSVAVVLVAVDSSALEFVAGLPRRLRGVMCVVPIGAMVSWARRIKDGMATRRSLAWEQQLLETEGPPPREQPAEETGEWLMEEWLMQEVA